MTQNKIKANNYGDLLAQVLNMELLDFQTYGSYQGHYLAVLKEDERVHFYIGYYGSCSGCDWLEAEIDYADGTIDYKEALDYCNSQSPARFILPIGLLNDEMTRKYLTYCFSQEIGGFDEEEFKRIFDKLK